MKTPSSTLLSSSYYNSLILYVNIVLLLYISQYYLLFEIFTENREGGVSTSAMADAIIEEML